MLKEELIEGLQLSNLCDYSFGYQAGIICGIFTGFMKQANINNQEFLDKVNEIKKERSYMTLFIDNIRLYKRDIKVNNISDQVWINKLMDESDLLNLCSQIKDMNFIIFTNLEDTPIDKYIEGKIPSNILSINAVNSIYYNDKINPLPYGLQTKMNINDNRLFTMIDYINKNIQPQNLLYVNHNINTNLKERSNIKELFIGKNWAKVESTSITYEPFLENIKKHKFIICPIGNAIDCHRNWEVLYMKRVPVMKKNEYLEYLFKDFPVLFIDNYSDITENLLIEHENLYIEALNINLNKLNLNIIFNGIIKNNIKI